jgi:hypothetical protein
MTLAFENLAQGKYANSAVWSAHNPKTLQWVMQEGFGDVGGMSVVEANRPFRFFFTC